MNDSWFEKSFGEDYLKLYSHRNASEAAQLVELILRETSAPADAVILDAPCGAGRHLRAFHDRGFRAFGFDLSAALLRAAHKTAGIPSAALVRADLRALPYRPASVDLLVNLFSSLGYFPTDEDNLAVLCALVSLVRPDGWVVIDFMNGDHVCAHLEPESFRKTADGIQVRDRRWIEGTPPRVNKKTTVVFPDGRQKIFDESVRLFSPDELIQALSNCGVHIRKKFGDYAGAPFTSESKRIILMGQCQ